MEIRTLDDWQGPLPAAEDLAGTFWRAAAEGRLLIQKCPECGQRQHYPRHVCTGCGGSPEWEEASGQGVVHTFTVIRQNGARPFKDQLPYVVAMVELDEGPRLMGHVTGITPEDVYVGMPVNAYALKVSDDIGIPNWEPRGGTVG
jgi:uncharacterized protein